MKYLLTLFTCGIFSLNATNIDMKEFERRVYEHIDYCEEILQEAGNIENSEDAEWFYYILGIQVGMEKSLEFNKKCQIFEK